MCVCVSQHMEKKICTVMRMADPSVSKKSIRLDLASRFGDDQVETAKGWINAEIERILGKLRAMDHDKLIAHGDKLNKMAAQAAQADKPAKKPAREHAAKSSKKPAKAPAPEQEEADSLASAPCMQRYASPERVCVVHWYSFSNPRTLCIHSASASWKSPATVEHL